jgi:hypothetical protein
MDYCFVRPVHPAYNPSFSACFFSRNSIFLSQQISQQCFSVGLSAQLNKAVDERDSLLLYLYNDVQCNTAGVKKSTI